MGFRGLRGFRGFGGVQGFCFSRLRRNRGTIPQQLQTTLSAPDGTIGMGDSNSSMPLAPSDRVGFSV